MSEGIITALAETDAEVQIGSLRVRAKLADLEHRAAGDHALAAAAAPQRHAAARIAAPSGTRFSLGQRHRRREWKSTCAASWWRTAWTNWIDTWREPTGAGLPFVRIIHGKGTGKLREAVRGALKESPYVTSFEEAHDNEGGAGVTIAKLARG